MPCGPGARITSVPTNVYGTQYRMICTICSCRTVITVLLHPNDNSLFAPSYHICGSKSEAWWSILELCRIFGSLFRNPVQSIFKETPAQMFICWLMHRRIVFAMPCICTTKKAAPEMICCQLYARACRRCRKLNFYSTSCNYFIARIYKIVKC